MFTFFFLRSKLDYVKLVTLMTQMVWTFHKHNFLLSFLISNWCKTYRLTCLWLISFK